MKILKKIFPLVLLLIITIPSFNALLKGEYYTMHDDQHVARLHLLSEAIGQGSLYPRWVDGLGFGFGYPLFNFYPPLIYYISLLFFIAGFSLTSSIKIMIISGFIISAWSMYYLARQIFNKLASYTAAVLYIYFGYRAILVYVRGALAEFYTLAILPLVLGSIIQMGKKPNIKYTIYYSLTLALLLLSHPLIAAPAMIYVLAFFIFYLIFYSGGKKFITHFVMGSFIGFALSAFYWLPSQIERSYTMVDKLLTRELANYLIHFVSPFQFWYSPWGWGGSIAGIGDGMSFALGKIFIISATISVLMAILLVIKKIIKKEFLEYLFLLTMLLFSLFMTTELSALAWKWIKYLWYMQFPWRFLSFVTIFISIVSAYFISFLELFFKSLPKKNRYYYYLPLLASLFLIIITISINSKYFKPQKYINVADQQLTSKQEIENRVSTTSFEFIPKQVLSNITKKEQIAESLKKSITPSNFEIISGKARITTILNNFSKKELSINAQEQLVLRINIFYFPGWAAYLDGKKTQIQYDNALNLMTMRIPTGEHILVLKFENTSIRNLANFLSIASALLIIYLIVQHHKFRSLSFLKKS